MTERAAARADHRLSAVIVAIFLAIVVALAGLRLSWVVVGPPKDLVALATLAVLGILSVWLREPDVGSRISFSFLSIVQVSCVVLVGPVGGVIVGALSSLVEPGRVPKRVRTFNVAMSAILGSVGGLTYHFVGGISDLNGVHGPVALLLHVGAPLMVADVAQMLANGVLLATIVHLHTGVPLRRFFVQMVTNSGIAYIGYGFIGFLFVILWGPADVGPFSAVLILAPLFVARWAFVQFGEEQRAHERALSALVTAVETKDPHAAGHSARIAVLAEWMAQPLSLGAQEVESLRFSAMLHDVGKVGVPTRLLRRPRSGATGSSTGQWLPAGELGPGTPSAGSLARADIEAVARHPQHGVEVVRGIDFLQGSLDGILHHHERWDGQGYPDGLAGQQIPLFSRVIAVADAFDAFTTDRPDRPALPVEDALIELRARAEGQFDPAVVDALHEAIARHPWPRTEIPAGELETMRGYLDHDHPPSWEQASRINGLPAVQPSGREVATELHTPEPHEIRLS